MRKSVFAATERNLEDFLGDQTAGIPRENVLTYGSASREIIQTAEDRKADLVIMGTHGKKGPGRFLLGSVAERVIRHAPVPVLVVKESQQ